MEFVGSSAVISSEKVSFYGFSLLFLYLTILTLVFFFVGLAIETHKLQIKEMHQQHENEVTKHIDQIN